MGDYLGQILERRWYFARQVFSPNPLKYLNRFQYKADLEFLQNDRGERVAAFGYHAGFAGAALALECWAWQLTHKNEKFPSVSSYNNESALITDVKKAIAQGMEKTSKAPRVLVVSSNFRF
jgi:hypothetical protein